MQAAGFLQPLKPIPLETLKQAVCRFEAAKAIPDACGGFPYLRLRALSLSPLYPPGIDTLFLADDRSFVRHS
jgi:hypothetical protein